MELKIAQFNNTNTSSPSKLDNSGNNNKDTAAQLIMANITLHHIHINAIANYYNIPQLKKLINTKI